MMQDREVRKLREQMKEEISKEFIKQMKPIAGWKVNKVYLPDIVDILEHDIMKIHKEKGTVNAKQYIKDWIQHIINDFDGLEYFIKVVPKTKSKIYRPY